MKRKRDQRRCRGTAGKIPALIFCAAAVLCIVIWVMRHAQMQEGNEPDVVASRCENNVYDLTVAANCDAIKDTEAVSYTHLHNQALAPMADRLIHIKNGQVSHMETNENPMSIDEIEW